MSNPSESRGLGTTYAPRGIVDHRAQEKQESLPLDMATDVPSGPSPSPASASGFKANLKGASLLDLVQLECLSMGRSLVRVVSGRSVGRLYFSGGQIVHAVTGNLTGEEAAVTILSWTSGSFERMNASEWPETESITCVWQSLVMRAAQLRDEGSSNTGRSRDAHFSFLEGEDVFGAVEIAAEGGRVIEYGEVDGLEGLTAYLMGGFATTGKALNLGEVTAVEVELSQAAMVFLAHEDGSRLGIRLARLANAASLREQWIEASRK